MDNHQFLGFKPGDTWIHQLNGTSKLTFFICISIASMVTFDTRLLIFMGLMSMLLLKLSKITYSEVSFVVKFVFIFSLVNLSMVYVFDPAHGQVIYGSSTIIFGSGRFAFTKETAFYLFNLVLKYFVTLPLGLVFLLTTDPSEFASSLNKIGISYKIGYAVALALRYIPDIQDEFFAISQSQQARGFEMSSKAKLSQRVKGASRIVFPLIFNSLERIDTVSAAMELRRFGKSPKRSWYSYRPFSNIDKLTIVVGICIFALTFALFWVNDGRFFNPFM